MITENLSTLKINKLTQEQYDRACTNGKINSGELYLTPDEDKYIVSVAQDNSGRYDVVEPSNCGDIFEAIQQNKNVVCRLFMDNSSSTYSEFQFSFYDVYEDELLFMNMGIDCARMLGISIDGSVHMSEYTLKTDSNLNLQGCPADAKAVGDQLRNVNYNILDATQSVTDYVDDKLRYVNDDIQSINDDIYSLSNNKLSKISGGTISGEVTLNKIKLTNGVNYGTEEQMHAISSPSDGQLFFVIV